MLERPLHDGIALRLLEEADTDELYAVIDAHRTYLSRWMHWAPDQTIEDTREFIRLTRRQLAANDGIQTAIVVDGAIVGVVGVLGVNWLHRNTSIGYWIAEPFQGRGAVTAAVAAYTSHAFSSWRLERMELQAAVDNDRSRAVAERLGFTFEGVLRRVWRLTDRWVDHAVYSMLAGDWKL